MRNLEYLRLTDTAFQYCCKKKVNLIKALAEHRPVLRGGLAVGRWTCYLQVVGSIVAGPLSCNIGQLSLASPRGR